MNTARRFVFGACIAALISMAGAAMAQSPPLAAQAQGYKFTDRRPPKQLKSGFESLAITSCAYGSRRVGDNDLAADFASLLKEMLNQRFGDKLAGKAIALEGFTVHLNNAAALRKQVGRMYSGVIPDLMNKREKVGCEGDDLRGGYELGEIEPIGSPPIVAAIQIKIDGTALYARSIIPATLFALPTKKSSPELKEEWNRVVDSLAQVALTQLGDRIGQQLFGESIAPTPPGQPTIGQAAAQPPEEGAGAASE